MLINHLKITFRNLWRRKTMSAINIFGLAVGIATCLVIALYVIHQLSYDRFHEKADRIVRVVFRGNVQGEQMNEAHVMPPTAQALLADYPEVEEATRLRIFGTPRIKYGEKSFREDAVAFVDANFFSVFTLPLIHGDAATALTQPNTVVISDDMASKYFGKEDPVGKVLTLQDQQQQCKVTGVMQPIPSNSHFNFDVFISMASLDEAKENSWLQSEFYTYLVLQPGYDYRELEAKLPQVAKKYMSPQMQESMGVSLDQFMEQGNNIGLYLQPLTEIYLHSDFLFDLGPRGDIRHVYIFEAIALFMLVIACINFMNLSTASASKRAREVGVRKVMGSGKWSLIWQFLTESVMLTAIAMLLALGLTELALPVFNQLAGTALSLSLWDNWWMVPAILALILGVGLLAGSYPAFYLSSFRPVAVLKGKFSNGNKTLSIRSILVVFQFSISIIMIFGTMVVHLQLQYLQKTNLGYNKDQVLILPETHSLGSKEEAFKQLILQDSRIQNVSSSGYLPAGTSDNNNFFIFPEEDISLQIKTIKYEVDDAYIPTLGITLIAGRNFSDVVATDKDAIILNETAAKALGWGDGDAVGKIVTNINENKREYRAIGVVEDFYFRPLHEAISPLVMVAGKIAGTIIIKTKTHDTAGLLATLEKHWASFGTEEPFVYSFLSDRVHTTYQSEQKAGFILAIAAGLTILIACLGLFGLATFTAEQRTKEIGIRKILGASVSSILGLLSQDFIKLVLIAFIIAAPLAWLGMSEWLEDYARRIDLAWWIFASAGGLALFITICIISIQSIKAAVSNPVKSLRNE